MGRAQNEHRNLTLSDYRLYFGFLLRLGMIESERKSQSRGTICGILLLAYALRGRCIPVAKLEKEGECSLPVQPKGCHALGL